MLKLMYITNNPEIAKIAEESGVDRVFVDMEYIGKDDRQGGLDTVKNHHSIEDVKRLRSVLKKSELLVRVNPIHDVSSEYCSSEDEINATVEAGADIVMLPFFKTVAEVERFIKAVDGRAKTMLLLETPEAVDALNDILKVKGIDEIHIGLNDLHLGMHLDFMFELLTNGVVEQICGKIKKVGIPYGFGGIARMGGGILPTEYIIAEHYRLGSTCAILSRSFCDTSLIDNLSEIEKVFKNGINDIRQFENSLPDKDNSYYIDNQSCIKKRVEEIVKTMREKRG